MLCGKIGYVTMGKWPSKKNLYNILGLFALPVLLLFVNIFLLQVGCFVFGSYLCFMRDAVMLKSGVYCGRSFVANVCIVEIGWLCQKLLIALSPTCCVCSGMLKHTRRFSCSSKPKK